MLNDYESFKKEVYNLTKIDLNAYKEKQMKRRIDTLILRHHLTGYDSFVNSLRTDKDVLEDFVNYLTINVSEFYRNPDQWEILEKEVIPLLKERFNSDIKIWSASCSTGDEPYSLAMSFNKQMKPTDYSIYATDIDKQVLDQAKNGYGKKYADVEKSVKSFFGKSRSQYVSKQNSEDNIDIDRIEIDKDILREKQRHKHDQQHGKESLPHLFMGENLPRHVSSSSDNPLLSAAPDGKRAVCRIEREEPEKRRLQGNNQPAHRVINVILTEVPAEYFSGKILPQRGTGRIIPEGSGGFRVIAEFVKHKHVFDYQTPVGKFIPAGDYFVAIHNVYYHKHDQPANQSGSHAILSDRLPNLIHCFLIPPCLIKQEKESRCR